MEINGWRLYAHPLFLDQLEALIQEVDKLRRKDPQGYGSKNASKRLAAIWASPDFVDTDQEFTGVSVRAVMNVCS